MPSLVEIGPVVLEKESKIGKVYDNNEDKDDDEGQQTNYDQKRSHEPSTLYRLISIQQVCCLVRVYL